jgi:hypothetical protein
LHFGGAQAFQINLGKLDAMLPLIELGGVGGFSGVFSGAFQLPANLIFLCGVKVERHGLQLVP